VRLRRERDDQPCDDEGYSTHLLAKEACRLVRQERAKPLFLYLPFNAVHAPHQVPGEYLKPYDHLQGTRQKYAGMLAAMDEAVGQVVAALEETKQFENTLFVFTSDTGGPSPGKVTNTGDLRAGKGTLYEGGLRVCAFAHYEGKIPAGTKVDTPIHAVDWFPTITRLAGGTLPANLELDGIDVWPALAEGKPLPRDTLLHCGGSPDHTALRVGDWKLIVSSGDEEDAAEEADNAAGKKKKKANKANKAASKEIELFNLAADPSEKTNLAETHSGKVQEMRAKLHERMKAAVPSGAAAAKG
jgi:arylsulfatase A-like enzyme